MILLGWLPARGAEPDALSDLQARVEQLEQSNAELSEQLQSSAFGRGSEAESDAFLIIDPHVGDPAFDQEDRHDVAAFDEPAGAVDLEQNQQLFSLQRAFDDFVARSKETRYPNITVNGVFQADVGWFHQDQSSDERFGRIEDGADFRRARLSAKGSVTPDINYFFQMDFAFFGRPTFTDVWVEQTQVPYLGTVRVGQWKQPFSLEVVSSFRYTTFMERSLLFQAFVPFRRLGAGFYNHSEDLRATWAASVFRSGQDQFGGTLATDGGWGTAERITYMVYWDEPSAGRDYLEVGASHFFNAPPHDTVNFRTIPEFFVGANAPNGTGTSGQAVPGNLNGTPFFVETGNLRVNAYNVLGAEMLWVRGPFSLQSEGMLNVVNQGSGNPTAFLTGAYAQVGYFLTGEHRPFDRKAGAIDRVIPHENFSFLGGHGCGAWEVAARYSRLDLNDHNIDGGRIHNYTLGVNWYTSPYTKVTFNYIRSVPTVPVFGTSHTDMFGLRTQIDF